MHWGKRSTLEKIRDAWDGHTLDKLRDTWDGSIESVRDYWNDHRPTPSDWHLNRFRRSRNHGGVDGGDMLKGIIAGVLGGLAASFLMTQFQTVARTAEQKLKSRTGANGRHPGGRRRDYWGETSEARRMQADWERQTAGGGMSAVGSQRPTPTYAEQPGPRRSSAHGAPSGTIGGGSTLERHAGGQQPTSGTHTEESEEKSATVKTANRASQLMRGRPVAEEHEAAAGQGVHYGFGGLIGALYGGLAEAAPAVTMGAGVPFGAVLWVLSDEIMVPALGLSKPPTQHSPKTHIYALASHLVYGAATEGARRALRKLM